VCKKCLNEKIDFLQFYPAKEYLKLKKNDEIIHDSNNEELNKDKTQENPIILLNKKRKYDDVISQSSFKDNHKKKISNELTGENYERRKEINIKEIILNDTLKDKEKDSSEFCKMKLYLDSTSQNKEENDKNINILKNKKDIFIDLKNFYHALCRCSKCKIRYSNAGIEFISFPDFIQDWESRTLIEDKLNKEAEEETTQNQTLISNINNFNFLETKNIQNLPVEKVQF